MKIDRILRSDKMPPPMTLPDFHGLTNHRGNPCISIICPMVKSGDTGQNSIRIKNLLRKVEKELKHLGLKSKDIELFLKKPKELTLDNKFWEYQNLGLALYLSNDFYRIYSLPISPVELSVVSQRFYTKPLLPVLLNNGRFFLLSLDMNGCRLFEGTIQTFNEIKMDFPPIEDLADEQQLQQHSIKNQPQGSLSQIHGQGGGKEDKNAALIKFLSQTNKMVHSYLNHDFSPLILSGVQYLHPIYERINTHPRLISNKLTSNTQSLSNEELHKLALDVAMPIFKESKQKAHQQFNILNKTKMASTNIQDILRVAHEGRVSNLLYVKGKQIWGQFRPNTKEPVIHNRRQPGDEDLLDLACLMTMNHRGSVYVVEPEEFPKSISIAATYRY